MRLWSRNWAPSVALICELDSSWSGNGSEPNLRIVTRLLASAGVKPPMPPAEIWTCPFGMEPWMTGAEMTAPVEDDREVVADVRGGVVREQLGALVLEHEVDGQPAGRVLADRRRLDLVAAEQRRVRLEVDDLAFLDLGLAERHEFEEAGLADELADGIRRR